MGVAFGSRPEAGMKRQCFGSLSCLPAVRGVCPNSVLSSRPPADREGRPGRLAAPAIAYFTT